MERRFSELYVWGFQASGGYDGIPLEVNAYALGRRFEADPRQPFSVAEEVGIWVREELASLVREYVARWAREKGF